MVKHVFFDLDHTLWDFDHNAGLCLERIFKERLTSRYSFSPDDFKKYFSQFNRQLWRELEKNHIAHAELRLRRFQNTIEFLGETCSDEESLSLNARFMELLPQQTQLIPHTFEVLDYLKTKYQLHILSNGFLEVQVKKMQNSGIRDYFSSIITSDLAQAKKPDPEIFEFALRATKGGLHNSIYIGDDEIADKEGAKNAGFRFIHFNSHSSEPEGDELITSLLQLKQLL